MKRARVSLDEMPDLLTRWATQLGLSVNAKPSPSGDEQGFPNRIELSGEDTPLLGAQKGLALDALQYLAQEHAGEYEEANQPFLDAGSLRLTRMRELRVMASFAAGQAREVGSYTFAPLSPRERRWVHLGVATLGEDLHTESEGTGHFKALKVVRK